MDYVLGQMGGNRIVLLDGRRVPAGDELAVALRALDPGGPQGHQAGLLHPPERGGHLRVRVVSVSWRDFIPACGGLTQVLACALAETPLGAAFGVPLTGDGGTITLEFDAWDAPVSVERERGRFRRAVTDFGAFLDACRELGIARLDLDGLAALRVGTFLVLDADALRARFPDAAPTAMDAATQEILVRVQRRCQAVLAREYWDFCLYDWRPEGGGDARIVFPHSIAMGHIEPSCGTGSVAAALGLAWSGELDRRLGGGASVVRFESGGAATLGGPDITEVRLARRRGEATGALLTHDNVTVLEQGVL